jgi:tRNA(Ile)-lysidine synthase
LTRPLLDLPKSRLIATLHANGVSFTEDTSNRDPRFTRVRWRALMPPLADEGLDARNLARLAERAGRAEAALELAALGAERALVRPVAGKTHRLACDRLAFAALPDEIRLRLLGRMIARAGLGGPPELGKLETMLDAVNSLLTGRPGERLKRTLAGAIVAVDGAKIAVERAPPRRHASRKA